MPIKRITHKDKRIDCIIRNSLAINIYNIMHYCVNI